MHDQDSSRRGHGTRTSAPDGALTAPHEGNRPAGRYRERGLWARATRALRGAVVGALPGVALVLIAQFAIDGEMQLTVGAPGLLLAVAGAVLGLAYGSWPRRS